MKKILPIFTLLSLPAYSVDIPLELGGLSEDNRPNRQVVQLHEAGDDIRGVQNPGPDDNVRYTKKETNKFTRKQRYLYTASSLIKLGLGAWTFHSINQLPESRTKENIKIPALLDMVFTTGSLVSNLLYIPCTNTKLKETRLGLFATQISTSTFTTIASSISTCAMAISNPYNLLPTASRTVFSIAEFVGLAKSSKKYPNEFGH